MRHIKTPELLWPALRQYRHNTDNSPNINHPENCFVTGFDYDETVVVIKRLEQQLAELREAASAEVARQHHQYAILRQELPPTTAALAALLQEGKR